MNITEGYMPFMGHKTYYRITGNLNSGKAPLILMHGGPGSTHNYFELLDSVAELTGNAFVNYDQIGCGNSYLDGHPELWTPQTWLNELCALIDHLQLKQFHLLGQSWGGMLELMYLIERKAAGVKSAILSSSLPSSELYAREQHRLIKFMSQEDQEAIAHAEASNDFSSEAYQRANDHFMQLHCSSAPTASDPECLRRPKRAGGEAYLYGWGPNEYTPTGTLRNFDYTARLGEIKVPTLIISGTNDMCTPLIAKTMHDAIEGSRWELFDGARHMTFAEQPDHYRAMLAEWLRTHE